MVLDASHGTVEGIKSLEGMSRVHLLLFVRNITDNLTKPTNGGECYEKP
jgi:hypothetical protein